MQMLVDTAAEPDAAVRIVATLRADFLDRPLGYAGFADAIKGRTIALGTMSAAELAEAVCRPAVGVGVEVEPALVDRITAEAADAPGALPLVQHQMAELFAQRTANVLTLAAYEESGGLAGAIGRRAEAIYNELDDRSQSAAREVFLRLVSVDEEHEDTRRRVRRPELEHLGVGTDELDMVLREYGRHRLLTFDRDAATRTPTVEVAHEALLGEWPRLKDWIDDARDDLLTRRRIESAAHDWLAAGSDASFLFTGGRLELAESWAAESDFELTEDEQRFLTASRTRVDRDAAARARRRRRITQVLVGAVVVTAAVAAYALVQRSAADREARETRARELAGQAQLAIEEDPERAMMLALAASEETSEPLPETVPALHAATQSMRLVDVVDGVGNFDVAYHPDGSMVAVDRRPGQPGAVFLDPANGDVLADVQTPYPPGSLAFEPGGAELAVGYDGSSGAPAIGRFEVPSGRAAGGFSGSAGSYWQLSYHPDGDWIGALRDGAVDSEIVVWAVDSPDAPISLGPGTAYAFLPGTTSVAIARGGEQASLAVVNIETGEVVRSIEILDVDGGISVDPTAHRLALVSSAAEQVVVLDLDRGEPVETLDVVGPQSASSVTTADGSRLAPSTTSSTCSTPRPSPRRSWPDRRPSSVRWRSRRTAPGWRRSARANFGSGIWRRRVTPRWGTSTRPARWRSLSSAKASRRRWSRTESPDASVTVERIDLATGDGIQVADGLHFQRANMGPLISGDLHLAAGLDDEFRTHVIDLDTGADVELGRCEVVRALDQTGRLALIDGEVLCEADSGQAVLPGPGVHSRVLDLRTGGTVLDLGARDMWSGVFGPPAADGLPGLVAVLLPDYTVTVYRLPTGELLGSYTSTDGFPLAAAFTADGRRLAVTKDTGQLAVIDIARLAPRSRRRRGVDEGRPHRQRDDRRHVGERAHRHFWLHRQRASVVS